MRLNQPVLTGVSSCIVQGSTLPQYIQQSDQFPIVEEICTDK